ncbi:pyridoxal phosphate-dependent transferase [Lipomyces starkeyi]
MEWNQLTTLGPSPFGHGLRKYFLFDSKYTNLNHGSFGTYPIPVRDHFRNQQEVAEAQPDRYLRYTYPQLLDKSRATVADLLHIPANECVFLPNATTGVNTVLRNIVYSPNDVIIYFDTIYAACEKTILSVCETTPAKCRKVEYQFMTDSHRAIVEKFEEVIQGIRAEGLTPKVTVIDTIVSLPGVRFPFEMAVETCRNENVLSLIDGAHGIGHIPLNLKELDADFFTSNCHKWLFTPRGCAVLHVPVRNQHLIRTSYPTSHGFRPIVNPSMFSPLPNPEAGKTPFETLFEFVATTDTAPYTCAPAALAFRRDICGGEEKITEYIKTIVTVGTDAVARILGTEVMATDSSASHDELRNCALANVRLPLSVGSNGDADVHTNKIGLTCNWMQKIMVDKFHTFIPIFFYAGNFWVRYSGQVYLELSDFEWSGKILKALCEALRLKKSDGLEALDLKELKTALSKE